MSKMKRLREARGLSTAQLAGLVGTSQVQIVRLEKWPDGGKDARKLTVEWANKIAPHLGCEPKDLLFDDAGGEPTEFAVLAGTVAAGTWYDSSGEFGGMSEQHISIAVGAFPALQKLAYRVQGDSCDLLRLFDGDYAIAIPFDIARSSLRDGDVLVVERHNGALVERTIKQVSVVDGIYRLEPRSTNQRYRAITIDPTTWSSDDGTETHVVGLVIGSYRPFATAGV